MQLKRMEMVENEKGELVVVEKPIEALEPKQRARIENFERKAQMMIRKIRKGPPFMSYEEDLRKQLAIIPYVPILFSSAKTGFRVNHVIDKAVDIAKQRRFKIPSSKLNQVWILSSSVP